MKKIFTILSCIAIILIACEKNKQDSTPQTGPDKPVGPPAVEYLDLLVTAPASMTDGWTEILDTIYVSTGGYKLYPYYATESGSPARFTSAVEKSGIVKAATYSLNISLGDEDTEYEIPSAQTIVNGENTTEMPCVASCVDKAANSDGLLEVAFSTSSGTKIIFNFEKEPFVLNTLSLTTLGGESLVGQSESVQITFQDGLDLSSSGGKAPVFITPVDDLLLSRGILAIANEDSEDEVVRIILGGRSLSFSDSESGPYANVDLDKWKLGGIASADDLIAFSYCSSHGRTLSHFVTEVASDPDITLTSPANMVKLLGDIDMTDREWQPITHFTGIFDGDGHTIDNLVYSFDGEPTQLVFTKTSSGTSKPRELFSVSAFIVQLGEDSTEEGASVLRDITFGPGCKFSLSNTKEIPEWRYGATGGLIARVGYNSVLKNVKNKATIDIIIKEGKANANIFAGGTVGLFNGSLIDGCTIEGPLGFCLAGSGAVWMNTLAIGGICGTATSDTWVPVTVSNCSVKATASMYAHIRTLINYLMETDLYAVGNFGRCSVGGIIGSIAEIAGINKDNAKILNCSNEAPISAGWWSAKNNVPLQAYPSETDDIAYERNVATNLGGIVGLIGDKTRNRAATVSDCSNSGKILLTGFSQKKQETHSTAGGIVGCALTDASVFTNLENTGDVVLHGQQTGFVGGIIGCLVPASASGDNAYLGGNPSSVEYLHNAGNVYISGTKTYFKHTSPNIALGGLFGLVSGQVLETGSPVNQSIIHCYNEGDVFSACKGNDDNPATNVAFDLGGIAGRIGSCTFEDVINFGKVYTSKEHACEAGGFIGSVFEKAKTKQGGTIFSPIFQTSFKDCGQYGDVTAVTPSNTSVRMGLWSGWCALRGTQLSANGSGNKAGCSFGEYEGVQTAINSDNYTTTVVRGNVAADKTGTIRMFNGPDDADPEPDALWNSFSYGEIPAKPAY